MKVLFALLSVSVIGIASCKKETEEQVAAAPRIESPAGYCFVMFLSSDPTHRVSLCEPDLAACEEGRLDAEKNMRAKAHVPYIKQRIEGDAQLVGDCTPDDEIWCAQVQDVLLCHPTQQSCFLVQDDYTDMHCVVTESWPEEKEP